MKGSGSLEASRHEKGLKEWVAGALEHPDALTKRETWMLAQACTQMETWIK